MTLQEIAVSDKQDIPLVLALDDAAAQLSFVGGKGASLARLAGANLPVPPGFHITTRAYQRFVTENGLQEQILAAVSTATPEQPATLKEASERISKLFMAGVMPEEISEAICQAYARLGSADVPVAVRSSATAEDLPEMSFAGQQESYLNMRGQAMLLDAVKRCWASLWTARAIGYRARNHIAPQDVSLAVVVQELVSADASGVLFTANPLNGSRQEVMINAAWGLGEAIVSGLVTPDTIVVEKANGAVRSMEVADKALMTTRVAEGTREEPVPQDRRYTAVLAPSQAAELAQLGTQIEQLYGQPMDIEWALQKERFFIVQARPITTLSETANSAQPQPALQWQLPNAQGRYVRASVFELLPDPLSPLFATLGLPEWSKVMDSLMAELRFSFPMDMFAIINGYGYYDITLTASQAARTMLSMPRLLGIELPRLFRSAEQRWRQEHARYAELVKRWQVVDLETESAENLLAGAQEIVAKAAWYYLCIQSGILPDAYMSEMFFTIAYNRLIKRRGDPTATTFLLGYDSIPIQAEKSLYDLARWVRVQPQLAEALAGMSSAEFASAYQREQIEGVDKELWAEFRQRFEAHLAKFGAAIYDLDFAKPVPAEDPASLLEALKYFLDEEAPAPYIRQQKTASARVQAVQATLLRLRGLRLRLFRKLLGWAQHLAPLRENALADVGLGWPILRRMLREIGRRITEAGVANELDDVFWLTLDDLHVATKALDAQQQLVDYHTVVAERRALWERERAVPPPAALPIKGGARFLGMDFSRFMPAQTEQAEGDTLKGIGASPGCVTGPARVIINPSEFHQMKQGDILVARITTPAWTPLFSLAAGVVTDVGGPLSHSSIVAREYHIPAVLGTGVATERLHSGQRITVDGDAGTVTHAR
ncbi:phosphoenolpyruvate synthase [Ktedonosporobacter rubrisoli]|uniref:Phosphoenolpyruvate synthase n=1 Tax=Ktedonosporobacter rubrisoli TaxID=2509675 RepID=A0A4P6JTC7_KTERU|nr:PEP/pyruvate-binding domain-containing protein [Ktedonosporobacter rubrisoli]QBD78512.1 phosphoenolpyruvate synthase [Ktedonosporobacter rubrisoli]